MKSLWRHFFDVWKQHRGYKSADDLEESLCAVMFNAMGYLAEMLKAKQQTNQFPSREIPRVVVVQPLPKEEPIQLEMFSR